ncbi:MAG: hypothetical protein DLM58_24595 [Pseudonocardiales bacterium]|nr:MAG: hypothetical protein DLM58_24595 [Pseudonocardiales bacterium]
MGELAAPVFTKRPGAPKLELNGQVGGWAMRDQLAERLAIADALEAKSLRRYRQLRRRRKRGDRIAVLVLASLVCGLQAVLLFLTGGGSQPLLAAATLLICLVALLPLLVQSWTSPCE